MGLAKLCRGGGGGHRPPLPPSVATPASGGRDDPAWAGGGQWGFRGPAQKWSRTQSAGMPGPTEAESLPSPAPPSPPGPPGSPEAKPGWAEERGPGRLPLAAPGSGLLLLPTVACGSRHGWGSGFSLPAAETPACPVAGAVGPSCSAENLGPRQEGPWSGCTAPRHEWSRKCVCLSGPGTRCCWGVFRCQLSCDSRQPSPSNRGCGVPSSLGWEAGKRLPGRRSRQSWRAGRPRKLEAPGSVSGQGSTETPGSPLSRRSLWGERAGTPLPPSCLPLCVRFLHAHVPLSHFHTKAFHSTSWFCWRAAGLGRRAAERGGVGTGS